MKETDVLIVGAGPAGMTPALKLAGEHFLLPGDTASLVDPFSGEGIGNAMASSEMARDVNLRCFEQDRLKNRLSDPLFDLKLLFE
jgi:flavin-dependent dehydrogenase